MKSNGEQGRSHVFTIDWKFGNYVWIQIFVFNTCVKGTLTSECTDWATTKCDNKAFFKLKVSNWICDNVHVDHW